MDGISDVRLAQSRSSCGFSYPFLKTGRQTCERQITVSQLGFLRWGTRRVNKGGVRCATHPPAALSNVDLACVCAWVPGPRALLGRCGASRSGRSRERRAARSVLRAFVAGPQQVKLPQSIIHCHLRASKCSSRKRLRTTPARETRRHL